MKNNLKPIRQRTSTKLFSVIMLLTSMLIGGSIFATCTASISITSSSIVPCSPIIYSATPSGNAGTTTYKWYRNNYQVGTNSTTYIDSLPRYNDSVWCTMVTVPCAAQYTTSSNKIYVTGVNTTAPSVSISASSLILGGPNPIFTAIPTNGGYRPSYTWYLNGSAIPNLHNAVMSYGGALGNGDQIYATITTTTCGGALSGTSNTLTLFKAGSAANDLVVFTLPGQIGSTIINNFAGTAFVTEPAGNSKVMHPSMIRVSPSASYGPSMYNVQDFSSPVVYTVRAQNGDTKAYTVTVVDSCTPILTASPNHNSPCSPITITALYANAGATPSFQWYENNIPVGTNSATYIDLTPNYNDSIWVIMTSNSCASARSLTSNKIYVNGGGNVGAASVSITANTTNLDLGISPVFTATSVNAGTRPEYTWYINGIQVGSIHNALLAYGGTIGNGDQVWATVTTLQCGGSTTTNSDTLTMSKSGANDKDIVLFQMPSQIGTSVIDPINGTVTATVPFGSRTSMRPDRFWVSTGATYGPSQAIFRDFTGPVVYTVTAQNGSHRDWTITVTDPNGFKTSNSGASSTIENSPATISDMFNAYPNPASTYLTIDVNASNAATVVTVVDIDGRVMYLGQIPANGTSYQVPVADLANGIYLLNVANGGKNATKRIVVAH